MKSLRCHGRWMLPLGLLLLGGQQGFGVVPPSGLRAEDIVRTAFQRAQTSAADARRAGYAYTKQVIVQEFDSQGRVTETKEKLFHFSAGLGVLDQIRINGHAASYAQVKKEEERTARQGAQFLEQKNPKRDDNWGKYLTPELADKYRYTLRERKLLNGRPTYVIGFEPKSANLPVHQMADRFLNQLAGTIWIDEKEFEIARAEIGAQSKVTLGGALELLGSLKQFSYTLERLRVGEGMWFNRLTKGDFEGRKLLDTSHVRTRSESSDFRKVSPG